jgi:hypothetical protein
MKNATNWRDRHAIHRIATLARWIIPPSLVRVVYLIDPRLPADSKDLIFIAQT